MASVTGLSVAAVPEIFLMILKELPMKELLLFQRVSHHWRDTIAHSSALQQKLFFKAITNVRQEPIYNTLVKNTFPSLFGSGEVGRDIFDCDLWRSAEYRNKMMGKDASWRKMYPVQPPAVLHDISVDLQCGCEDHPVMQYGEMKWPYYKYFHMQGPKLGYIWDLLAVVVNSGSEVYINMHWNLKDPDMYPKGSFRRDEKGTKRITKPQNSFYFFACHHVPHHYEPDGPSNIIKKVPLDMDSINWRWAK